MFTFDHALHTLPAPPLVLIDEWLVRRMPATWPAYIHVFCVSRHAYCRYDLSQGMMATMSEQFLGM